MVLSQIVNFSHIAIAPCKVITLALLRLLYGFTSLLLLYIVGSLYSYRDSSLPLFS